MRNQASKKSIVYFGQTPGQGTGSPINMLRHLRRLTADGWDISVVAEWGQVGSECQTEKWRVHHLPHRRCFWPPYRSENGFLRTVRMKLWAAECRWVFKARKPDAILSYLSYHSELMSEIAAHYSLATGIPMTVIVYDDALAFEEHEAAERKRIRDRFRWILRQARQNWFVSSALAEAYGLPPDPRSVLMPIPEGNCVNVKWRAAFRERPVIVYAGFIYDQQYPLLRRIAKAIAGAGGQLLILSRDTTKLRELCVECEAQCQPLFPKNREALEFVGNRAAAFLAAYCERIEDMPWIRTSFPSKVVEFGNLGVPVLFVSPPECAAYMWNVERNLPFNLRPGEINRVGQFVDALKDPVLWESLALPIRSLAETEFNADLIQERLVESLA